LVSCTKKNLATLWQNWKFERCHFLCDVTVRSFLSHIRFEQHHHHHYEEMAAQPQKISKRKFWWWFLLLGKWLFVFAQRFTQVCTFKKIALISQSMYLHM
jgi:hypothetical protein